MRLLVVTTDPVVLESLSSMLCEHNHETFLADSAKTAVSSVQAKSCIDMILTDFDLGDTTALELLEFIKNNLRFRHIPVVIFSQKADLETVKTCIQLGAKDFICMPVPVGMLLDKVQHAMERMRRTVLILEPNTIFTDILTRMMHRDGYEVVAASSAGEALKVIKSKCVDLTIMDPLVLDMSPWELLVAIKDIHTDSRVLFLIDSDNVVKRDDIIARGVDGFITRPLVSTAVRNKVREVLASV